MYLKWNTESPCLPTFLRTNILGSHCLTNKVPVVKESMGMGTACFLQQLTHVRADLGLPAPLEEGQLALLVF